MLTVAQENAILLNKINQVVEEPSSFTGDGLRMGHLRAQIEMNLWRPDAWGKQGQAYTDTALTSSKLESKE